MFVPGGAGNKIELQDKEANAFYDNIGRWGTKNGMVVVLMQRHPGANWDDPAKDVSRCSVGRGQHLEVQRQSRSDVRLGAVGWQRARGSRCGRPSLRTEGRRYQGRHFQVGPVEYRAYRSSRAGGGAGRGSWWSGWRSGRERTRQQLRRRRAELFRRLHSGTRRRTARRPQCGACRWSRRWPWPGSGGS